MVIGEHPRGTAAATRLARLGFAETARASQDVDALEAVHPAAADLLPALAATADPDLALLSLRRLSDAATDAPALLTALTEHEGLRDRLFVVMGASAALGEHLVRHPTDWHALADDDIVETRPSRLGLERRLLDVVGAPDPAGRARANDPAVLDELRAAYRRALLVLAARDLTAGLAVEDVAGELADLAGATLAAALTVARAGLPATADDVKLAVVGMGKCGGRELNYVSDVDVVFVAEPDDDASIRLATQLAAGMMRVCSDTTTEGSIWPVDAGLRPEGKAGPLVRSLASHEAYYKRWAKTWEFQALLKARPVAGDRDLGRRYVDAVQPLIWTAATRPDFVEDVQAMRRRVEDTLPKNEADRELKLGPGGLRDVEFAVQLLQLVHGRADDTLRSGTTLVALDALAAGGYVGRDDAAALAAAYRFLRATEHRLQLSRLRRTHLIPTAEPELRRLARTLGYGADPVAEFETDRRRHSHEVRRLHEKLFYRPLLAAVARLPAEDSRLTPQTHDSRLTPQAAELRLTALGFHDPKAALRHLEALTTGVSRRAAIQRTLLPVMLGWFADAADPDAGLLSFRQVSEALGTTPWFLRLLRDEGAAAERLARLLASSRYVADLLVRAPQAVALLADDAELAPRAAPALLTELTHAVERSEDWAGAVAVARGLRRRELLRIAAADLLGLVDLAQVGSALSHVAAATLAAALQTALRKREAETGAAVPVRLAVIGMGRLGGREQGYGSDADVLFVYDGPETPEATRAAHDVAEEMRRLLALPAPDPPLHVDADLRPEGRQGPLVRSLASYAAYYERWSSVWESQALLRAAFVAGDEALGRRFEEVIAAVRWPRDGLDAAAVREIRRVKARVEAERLPRGADPALHAKLGRGGLADVEWAVQLLQLRHAHAHEALRSTATLPTLEAARAAGLVDDADAAALDAAWRMATRTRNAVMLVRGRPADSVPTEPRLLAGVARVVGYPPGHSADLLEDYRRVTRRARAAFERVFFA